MNCHDAENLLITEKDGALTERERAALTAHLADCESCAAMSTALTDVIGHFKESAHAVTVPDSVKEWREVRARAAAPRRSSFDWARFLPAIGLPVAAAAALAFAFMGGQKPDVQDSPAKSAQSSSVAKPATVEIAAADWVPSAEFVEIPGSDDSPVVYVDEPSGWLVVWAVDSTDKTGS